MITKDSIRRDIINTVNALKVEHMETSDLICLMAPCHFIPEPIEGVEIIVDSCMPTEQAIVITREEYNRIQEQIQEMAKEVKA